jgi:hypothetical protein
MCRHYAARGMYPWMRQLEESLENPLSVHFQNEWLLATPGHITQQLLAMHVNVHKPQGRRDLCLHSRWTCQLIFGNADIILQL